MRKAAWWVRTAMPFVPLMLYALIVADYARRFDSRLNYIGDSGAAPEDVLGLGFWPIWAFIGLWFALACCVAPSLRGRAKASYWAILLAAFIGLSVMDYVLFGVLERQVIGGCTSHDWMHRTQPCGAK